MNMRKMSALTAMVLILIILALVTACTRKDNLVGDDWSDVTPQIAVDTTFTMGYSYTHEGKVYGTETNLLCGTEAGIEAISIIRFSALPDTTISMVEQPVLKLVATRRSPLSRNPVILSFHKLLGDWSQDSTDVISDANIVPLSIPNFTVQDTISTEGDTLEIEIPDMLVENWASDEEDTINVVIKAEGNCWLEFKSKESGNGPLLSFTYQKDGSDDTLSYSQRTVMDSYRITGTQSELTENTWKLKNLRPQRMYFKSDLPGTIFMDMEGDTLNSADLKRVTINKAELVLFVKNTSYYASARSYYLPYRVIPDTLVTAEVLANDDMELLTHTFESAGAIDADSVRIEITPIIQAFTSGDKTNNGIVIKNVSEMKNFGNIEFWHYSNAPAGKKPYIKILYTAPYLKGR